MCGIAGIIGAADRKVVERLPNVMERLRHRGPDDRGYLWCTRDGVHTSTEWAAPPAHAVAVLGHCRLSILDLSKSGWQPMSSPDGTLHVVYNGEIYNYVELRDELRRLGHEFRTRSDTEVLLAAYAQWGTDALSRFVGMFAFVLLDRRRGVAVLVRDFFGIKPLYYSQARDSVVFASEVKGLLEFGVTKREANPQRAYIYLRYGISDHGPETLLANVRQLPAGSYLELPLAETGDAAPVRYWRPQAQGRTDLSFADAAQRLRELFLESVALHLRSDVPVGAALSGGIDSSAVVAAMRETSPKLELHAFSYVASDGGVSEETWAGIAAQSANANLHKVRLGARDLQEDLAKFSSAQDQPFGSTSPYAQYCVFRAAHDAGVKVMLDGQGADEILGGYRFYMAARLASLLRKRQWTEAARFAAQCAQWPGVRQQWLALRAMDYLLPPAVQEPLRKLIGKELVPGWLDEAWFHDRGACAITLNQSQSSDVLRENLCRTLMETTLPGLLRYEDRNSMAFSVESRVPFLTPALVNFMLSLPEDYIIARDGTSKAVFRAAMRGIVPSAILDRRDKIGFATPERQWLNAMQEWVESLLRTAVVPCLRLDRVQAEWSAIISGRRPFTGYVWRWLNLIDWTQRMDVQWV